MGTNTNKKEGNAFEVEFCNILAEMGFWVHNMAQSQAGQPADVIAVCNGKAALIDCKLCSSKGFALSRIEPNQETAMDYWKDCNNGVGWFAIKFQDRIFMVSKLTIDQLKKRGITCLSYQDLVEYSTSLELWRTALQWTY